MNQEIFNKLMAWRAKQAKLDNIEDYKILQYKTAQDIASALPSTIAELLEIKGIGAKKAEKFGKDILRIVGDGGLPDSQPEIGQGAERTEAGETDAAKDYLEVGELLDRVNLSLKGFECRVRGEITSLNTRNGHKYFALKDKADGSVLNCFMWQSDFELSGTDLEEGMEIIAEGRPEIYKPTGRFTFRARSVEPVGEGALKKAYDALKEKLAAEGMFAAERKRVIGLFPEKIGIITSRDGAVLHDFLNNIGLYGFKLSFFDSRVEGLMAVRDLLSGIEFFKDKDIDVLVLIRGGGSLESLQAYNNEMLARAIAAFPRPVICGIGHDKDEPLACLAADTAVSTPTAAAALLRQSWDKALGGTEMMERRISGAMSLSLAEARHQTYGYSVRLEADLGRILDRFRRAGEAAGRSARKLARMIETAEAGLAAFAGGLAGKFKLLLGSAEKSFKDLERSIAQNSPERQLKLGYSLAFKNGRLIRSVNDLALGDNFNLRLSDGEVKARRED